MAETEESTTTAGKNQLLLGIDLGTSLTAVVTSKGDRYTVESVVGYPKDLIGLKLIGRPYLVGKDASDKHSFLDLRYPLEDGVLREYAGRDVEVATHLLEYVIDQAKADPKDELCAVIGVPARASDKNKAALLSVASELFDTVIVASEPFMVAYGMGVLVNAMVVDIGAGTVDVCALQGNVPTAQQQRTLTSAGNHINQMLISLISERYPEVTINKHIARQIKESHSFVGKANGGEAVTVELRVDGKPKMFDITEQVRVSCESIVPEIIESLEVLILCFPPEDHAAVLENIILAGGGSQIRGLAPLIAAGLEGYGTVNVTTIEDVIYSGCEGALELGKLLPTELWDQFG
ncbi:MAG: MamK family actin-like protein [Mariprofundus sp.]|nr:MamK family actin-like protein [Mariprofundus sp.]